MDLLYSLPEIRQMALRFWDLAGTASVIAFHGSMGSGKTTFIHALCDARSVKDVVGSPTFSIINEYEMGYPEEKKIFHIDLYRLKDEEEAIQAGVEDCLYSDHICLVEWPEKAPGIFPDDTLHVFIDVADSDTRKIRIGRN